jgi:curved DNA-binding protein
LKIAAGTENGKTIRIKGKGMPVYGKENSQGNLYLQLQVLIPEQLSKEERQLFEQLKKLHEQKHVRQN